MFCDLGWTAEKVAPMHVPFRDWLLPRLSDGSYFGVTAEAEGRDVGHAGCFTIDWPPSPRLPETPMVGNIVNVHVAPDFRRRGIARALMMEIEAMMQARGLRFGQLQASDFGRPLYVDMGWGPTRDMSKLLDERSEAHS